MRPKMSLDDRAKIFSPFDPLQGFREALREKEHEVEREAQAGDPRSVTPGGNPSVSQRVFL